MTCSEKSIMTAILEQVNYDYEKAIELIKHSIVDSNERQNIIDELNRLKDN